MKLTRHIHLFLSLLLALLASHGSMASTGDKEMAALQEALDDAMALWGSQNITQYKMEFNRTCECLPESLLPYFVIVDNSTVTDVYNTTSGEALNMSEPLPVEAFTVDILFETIQTAVTTGAPTIEVEYDEVYGFPISLFIDFDSLVADDELYLDISAFLSIDAVEEEIGAAKALWEAGGVVDYSYSFNLAYPFEVTVVNATIFSMATVGFPACAGEGCPDFEEVIVDPNLVMAVPELFDAMESLLYTTALDLTLMFDTEYGYPLFVSMDLAGDENITYGISDFTPLSEEAVEMLLQEMGGDLATLAPTQSPTISPSPTVSMAPTPNVTMPLVIPYYSKEFAFVGPEDEDAAMYVSSTSILVSDAIAPDGAFPVNAYERSAEEMFDLIYYDTPNITDAMEYVYGLKKFYMNVYTTSPNCTQILLLLDSLPRNTSMNATGPHSRYTATTTTSNAWERLEFTFLDQPDEEMNDSSVNAIVLLFAPGTETDDVYYFASLDSTVHDCDFNSTNATCEEILEAPVCSFTSEESNCTGIESCSDARCWGDEVCAEVIDDSLIGATSQMETTSTTTTTTTSASTSAITTLVSVAIMGVIAMVNMG
jgi:Family of unknown function (DUF6174)